MSLVFLQGAGGSGPPDSPLDPPIGFADYDLLTSKSLALAQIFLLYECIVLIFYGGNKQYCLCVSLFIKYFI